MKILHLSEYAAPIGGAEIYLAEVTAGLAAAGHENVTIFREAHPDSPASLSGRAIYLKKRNRQLLTHIQRERPDVIYLQNPSVVRDAQAVAAHAPTVAIVQDFRMLCPGLAKYFRRSQKICTRPYGLGCVPHIYLDQCATARHPASVLKIMRAAAAGLAALRNMTRLVFASTYMRNLAVQNGLAAQRMSVISLPARLPPAEALSPPPEGEPVILFAGRLEEEKGLPFLLHALHQVNQPWRLIVAGEGGRRAEYETLAGKLGLAGRVTFTGWLPEAEVKAWYQQVRLTAVPSVWPEPYCKVGADSLAHARPVVAFRVGGIPDWLKDGHSGYLVTPQDVPAYAACLERLLADRALAAQMGAFGRADLERQAAMPYHIGRLEHVFRQAAAEWKQAQGRAAA